MNSRKMQKYMIRMTFLSAILFAVRRLEFIPEKNYNSRNIKGLKSQRLQTIFPI